MDYESLKAELQTQIDIVKNKWMPICESEYNGDVKKLYNARASDIFNDVNPIWELTLQINGMEDRNELLKMLNNNK